MKKHSGGKVITRQNLIIDQHIDLGTSQNSYWIDAEFSVSDAEKIGFKLAQLKDEKGNVVKEVEVGYDAIKKQLYVDCTRSEKGIKNDKNIIQTAAVNSVNGKIKLQVLFDKSSLEVFGNAGEKVISTMIFPDEKATGLAAFSNGGKAVLNKLKVWDMSGRK